MNETKALTVEEVRKAARQIMQIWPSDYGHGGEHEAAMEREIDAILAALIRAVRAEMPCYRRWFAIDDTMPTCLDLAGDHLRCPSCADREGR